MNVLVLNCGSSSVKFKLFDADTEKLVASGLVEKVGSEKAIFNYTPITGGKVAKTLPVKDHEEAIRLVCDILVDPEVGVIESLTQIDACGHRVVHGAEVFKDSVRIDDAVKAQIRKCCEIAPLHNPANLTGIEITEKLLPGVPNVAVFDTAFHATLPRHAFLYGLPMYLYETHGIRKYGFHGTSHRFVARKAAELVGESLEKLRVITIHLGNGSSIAAVRHGKSIDTSMGYTPLEGLVMGTRSGDLDPALVQVIMQKEKLDADGAVNLLNKKSGLLGLSGVSNDVREIVEAMKAGNERAADAIHAFCYRVKKYVGAYIAALNGVDVIVFTAGIGENSSLIRAGILSEMEGLGVTLDPEANERNAPLISTGPVKVMVVPTNEELEITRDTAKVLKQRG